MGMFDMLGMMGKVKEMQAKMKEAQDNLAILRAEGDAGAGMVKAVASGAKQLISLEIDPDLLKPEEIGILQDLIVAATNKALQNAEELAKAELAKATEGIMPQIPGLDLNSMFGK